MVAMEDWLKSPVAPGSVRLHGTWSGTLTTAKHFMEVMLPINYDVPLQDVASLVSVFITQDRANAPANVARQATMSSLSSAEEPEEEKPAEKVSLLEVWEEVQKLLAADCGTEWPRSRPESTRNSGELPVPHSISSPEVQTQGLLHVPVAERLQHVQHHDEALKASLQVDMDALQNLATQLQEEKKELEEENERLQEELQQGGLGRFLANLRRKHSDSQSSTSSSTEGDAEEIEREDVKLGKGELWLSCHVTGKAKTRTHFLDISLPLIGNFQGNQAAQVLDTIAQSPTIQKSMKNPKEGTAWLQLTRLIKAEYQDVQNSQASSPARVIRAEQDDNREADAEDMSEDGEADAVDISEVTELKVALQSASDQLRISREALVALQSENMRMHCEADTLRERHAAWVGYMANAEVTAQQLRDQLQNSLNVQSFEASPPPMDETPASKNLPASSATVNHEWLGNGSQETAKDHKDLVHELKELERWAKELRTLTG